MWATAGQGVVLHQGPLILLRRGNGAARPDNAVTTCQPAGSSSSASEDASPLLLYNLVRLVPEVDERLRIPSHCTCRAGGIARRVEGRLTLRLTIAVARLSSVQRRARLSTTGKTKVGAGPIYCTPLLAEGRTTHGCKTKTFCMGILAVYRREPPRRVHITHAMRGSPRDETDAGRKTCLTRQGRVIGGWQDAFNP